MKTSVTIPSKELERLFLKAIGGKIFSKRVVSKFAYRILDRIERDYPELLQGIYVTAHKRYQEDIARRAREQREKNLEAIYGRSK